MVVVLQIIMKNAVLSEPFLDKQFSRKMWGAEAEENRSEKARFNRHCTRMY